MASKGERATKPKHTSACLHAHIGGCHVGVAHIHVVNCIGLGLGNG